MIRIRLSEMTALCIFLVLSVASSFASETWYVRPDGGTRYSAARVAAGLSAQCDGKHNAPYPGKGVNRPCAFNDYRFLWDDQAEYGKLHWVIAGGDKVILAGGPWRVGFSQGATSNDPWCRGGSGTFGCTNPPIPAGTPDHHTRILGANYGSCSNNNHPDKSKMTQIFGGFGVYTPMNIAGTQNLDIQCLEITRHSQCTLGGDPPFPAGCRKSSPVDDYDSDGIEEDNKTANVTLVDLWIHGHPGRGIKGPIGGEVTATRVDIAYNESAGWDFDDGSSTPFGPGAAWHFNYSTIEWSGCYQEYPIVHHYSATSCYGQSNQGYGDGVGTAPGQELDVYIDHSIFRYNTQDGEDFGHVDHGRHTFQVTDSISYGNSGGAFKWGWGFTKVLFENNVAIGDCDRLHFPLGDAPATYNAHLGDFCRSEDAISFNFEDGTETLFANNTIVTYFPTVFDMKCVPITDQGQTNCRNARFDFKNNIILGYSSSSYDYNGSGAGPAAFCGAGCNETKQNIGVFNRDHNIFYGMRGRCIANRTLYAISGNATNESCVNPLFEHQPPVSRSSFRPGLLDNYNVSLSERSPARGAGANIPGLTNDFSGRPYANPRSIGAVEYGSPYYLPPD